MGNCETEVKHSALIRYAGWIGIPLIAFCALYILIVPIIESRYDIVTVFSVLFLGGSCLYMCLLAFKVFPFLNAEIFFSDEGFTVNKKNIQKKYFWNEINELKHHASVQVLVLKNYQGKQVLAITEQASNYNEFVETAIDKVGLQL